MSTRTGKIARLPHSVRDRLNRRLQNGSPAKRLVAWLNSLPEVKAVLKAQFGGQPINEPNLSAWRKTGYREWLDQQEAKELVPLLAAEANELNPPTGPPFTDQVAVWLAARLMLLVRRLAAADLDDTAKWKLLHEAAGDIVALRKWGHSAERLKLDRERLDLDREQLELYRESVAVERQRSIDAWVDMLKKVARKDPRLLDAAEMLCKAIVENADPAVKSHVPPSQRRSYTAAAVSRTDQIKPN